MNIKILCLLIITLSLSQGLLIPHIGKLKQSKAPVYKLDLNVDPYHRWDHIAPDFKGPMSQFMNNVVDLLPLSDEFYINLGTWGEQQPMYQEYIEEIKGLANIFEVQWQKLFLVNFMYELSTVIFMDACTSMVAKDPNGNVIHGRNLDFWPWKLFSKDSAKVQVYRGDRYIATFDQIIGAVIVVSGMRQDQGYSITIDTRYWHDGFKAIIDNVVQKKLIPPGYLLRNILQEEQEYSVALDRLQNTDVASPVYFTIAGTDQGQIIEKQIQGYRSVYGVSPSSKNWFAVVTNYDAEDGDPTSDDRKTPITERLEKLGQANVTADAIFNIMKQYPTLNIASIYTTVYAPYQDYNDLTLWYGNIDDYEENNLRKSENNLKINDAYVNYEVSKQFPKHSFYGEISEYAVEILKNQHIIESVY